MEWSGWYARAFAQSLVDNKEGLRTQGITQERVEAAVGGKGSPWERVKRAKREFQRHTYRLSMAAFKGNWEHRVEFKLARWNIEGLRRVVRDRFITNMAGLGRLVAPRVASAVWGMAWNRWTTARRFQRRKAGTCLLGCAGKGGGGENRTEHYWSCEVGVQVGKRMLCIHGSREQRKQAMLQVALGRDVDERVCWALLVYGMYMATNFCRHQAGGRAWQGVEEGIANVKQHIRNAVEGHAASDAILRSRFRRERAT